MRRVKRTNYRITELPLYGRCEFAPVPGEQGGDFKFPITRFLRYGCEHWPFSGRVYKTALIYFKIDREGSTDFFPYNFTLIANICLTL